MFDKEIDFARLRTDTYTSNHRIPTVRPATAQEDALRRDLTINSLFYNIHTDSIEDWSGRGLSDLQARRIITPLDPSVTLADDPLRALRIIRFTARLGFELDPTMAEALATFDSTILNRKVTRNRIGIELRKMLTASSSKQVVRAMSLITDFKLYNSVFQGSLGAPWPHSLAIEGLRRLTLLCEYMEEISSFFDVSEDEKTAILVSAYVSPFLPTEKKQLEHYLHALFLETLKCSKRCAITAFHLVQQAHAAVPMLDLISSRASHASSSSIQRVLNLYWRSTFNALAQDPLLPLSSAPAHWLYKSGHLWPVAAVFSRCLRQGGLVSFDHALSSSIDYEKLFVTAAQEEGLSEVADMVPLLTGDDVMTALKLPPTKLVGELLDRMAIWQAHHLSASRGDALDMLHFIYKSLPTHLIVRNGSSSAKKQRTKPA